jgi:hypothetical protein
VSLSQEPNFPKNLFERQDLDTGTHQRKKRDVNLHESDVDP